ncbi:MAG: NUDIX hydrolase [Eubacteriales bacterium]|nr:NUDIX hydrolase [Eubacteriales bacterium]
MVYYEKELSREYKFKGKIINLRFDTVEMPDGNTASREIVEHNGGVAVIALDSDNCVYLVRQYRRPLDTDILEIPAGKLDKDEDHRLGAIRELKEETGLSAKSLKYLGGTAPSPGYTSEIIHLYLATELTQGEADPDEDEFLNLEIYPLSKAIEMIFSGEITDGKTINAILMAKEIVK